MEYSTSDFGTAIKTSGGRKPLLTPAQDMLEIADKIQHRLSTEEMLKVYGMRLSSSRCLKTFTVVAKYLECCCRHLSKIAVMDNNASLSIMDILTMHRSARIKETNEKVGNLDPVFRCGERGQRIIDGASFFNEGEALLPLGDDGKPDPTSDEYRTALSIQTHAAKELLSYDLAFAPETFAIYTLTAFYLKCAIETLVDIAVNSKLGEATFVLYEILDISVTSSRNGLELSFQPGAEAKRIIKSDAHTET